MISRRSGTRQPKQFTSWAFSQKVRDAGLVPSIGAVGCPYDNAVVEACWGRMQVELLNRKSWKTRIELATAIHDHLEIFHNSRRRHSVPLYPLEPDTCFGSRLRQRGHVGDWNCNVQIVAPRVERGQREVRVATVGAELRDELVDTTDDGSAR